MNKTCPYSPAMRFSARGVAGNNKQECQLSVGGTCIRSTHTHSCLFNSTFISRRLACSIQAIVLLPITTLQDVENLLSSELQRKNSYVRLPLRMLVPYCCNVIEVAHGHWTIYTVNMGTGQYTL